MNLMTSKDSRPKLEWFERFVGRDITLRFQFRGQFFPLDGTVLRIEGKQIVLRRRNGGFSVVDWGDKATLTRFVSVAQT